MKKDNKKKGGLGESLAEKYLVGKGYKIITKNFGNKFGEIDLIVMSGKTLVFVEVKLKVGDQFGTPEEMINSHKLKQIEGASFFFFQKYPKFQNWQKRIDAVCIVIDNDQNVLRLDHYENIGF